MFDYDSGSTHFGSENHFDQTLHPLLTPSILDVLFDYVQTKDAVNFRLVCHTWNKILRSKINPVLYKPVFSTLLKYLSKESLLKCRLVCSIWNDSIVESTRWTREGIYRRGEENDTFFPFAEGNTRAVNAGSFQRFHSKFGDLVPFPLPFAFHHFTAPGSVTIDEPHTLEFLRVYGHFIKCLHLHRPNWTFEDLRRILFELCPNVEHFKLTCGILPGTRSRKKLSQMTKYKLLHVDPENIPMLPNIKSLTLDVNFLGSDQKPRPFIEEFLLQLLKSCPNLEIFHCDVAPWYTRTWALDFICRNQGVALNRLRKIESLVDPDFSQIERVRLRQLPLNSLSLRIRYDDVTVYVLHSLLRSLKGTLSSLHLAFLTYGAAHEFPSAGDLQKLKYFHLFRFKGQLGFLKEMKSLEGLTLERVEYSTQQEFKGQTSFKPLLPNLKTLIFLNGIYDGDRTSYTFHY